MAIAFTVIVTSFIVVTSIISLIAAVSVAAVTSIVTVVAIIAFTINRHVFIAIPAILYKIHWIITGVVTTAIATPVFCVAWWNAQIKWFIYIYMAMYHDGPTVNHTWYRVRVVSNIDTPIKARLTYTDRYAHIGSQCCA
jgi:hypothetical protein